MFPNFLLASSVHGENTSMLLAQAHYHMVSAVKSECQLCKMQFATHMVSLQPLMIARHRWYVW